MLHRGGHVALLFVGLANAASREACGACTTVVQNLLTEWTALEPKLAAELPARLCAGCPLPSSCETLVAEGIQSLDALLNASTAEGLCEQLGICNVTGDERLQI